MSHDQLSLCVLTRDEEDNLPRCLRSVPFATDVVVLDSGSTDATVERARALGARVFVEEWRGFVAQKARATELAAHDWVLCLDADEELSPELAAEIQAALARRDPSVAGYRLPRKTFYLGRFLEHSGWWPEYRLRLFDRRRGQWRGRDPHGHFEVASGRVVDLQGALHHYNYRSLAHHLGKVNAYTSAVAGELAREGLRFRLRDALLRPPARFLKMYVLRRGFLDGWRGFLVAAVGAFYVFLKYAKLWELTRRPQEEATAAAPAAPPPGTTAAELDEKARLLAEDDPDAVGRLRAPRP